MSSPNNGPLFLVVEGPDGVGKTTLVRRLAESYNAHGRPCVAFSNPAGTLVGQAVKQAVTGCHGDSAVRPYPQLLLQMAAHHQLIAEKVLPNLQKGVSVILDRYLMSTQVYQGLSQDDSLESFYAAYTPLARALPRPAATIVLQASPDTLIARIRQRGRGKRKIVDVMETEAHLQKVSWGFARAVLLQGRETGLSSVRTDARSADEVFVHVWAELTKLSPLPTEREGGIEALLKELKQQAKQFGK